MAWEALFETATGRLISIGDVIASPLPSGLSSIALAGEPDLPSEMWDDATTSFIARPPKIIVDRLQDLITHPRFGDFVSDVWGGLGAGARTRVRNVFIAWLGRARWRSQGETEVIDPDA